MFFCTLPFLLTSDMNIHYLLFIIIIMINDSIYPAVSKASRTGNKVSCQPNDCPNRWAFKRRLKMASDGPETMSASRSFQTRGASSSLEFYNEVFLFAASLLLFPLACLLGVYHHASYPSCLTFSDKID